MRVGGKDALVTRSLRDDLLPSGTSSENYAAENIFGAENLDFRRLRCLETSCKTVADTT
jgi:hypothetical protein